VTGRRRTVFIVDDDSAVRQSLELLLNSVGLDVECFGSGDEFLDSYDADRSGCLLLDVRLPGASGLDLQQQLGSMHSILPIIFLTGHADVPLAVRAMQSGAFDFLEKPFSDQDLLDRTHAALDLDAGNREALGERRVIFERLAQLTPREREVMEQIVEGHANKVVADQLGISERTIEIHRARVMDKMAATSLPHLVRMWMMTSDPERRRRTHRR
jgi:FixJ family two-component response regulator